MSSITEQHQTREKSTVVFCEVTAAFYIFQATLPSISFIVFPKAFLPYHFFRMVLVEQALPWNARAMDGFWSWLCSGLEQDRASHSLHLNLTLISPSTSNSDFSVF